MTTAITTMNNDKLFYLLQLAGGTFPTGGFSQSWGLETYVEEGIITDSVQLQSFLVTYLHQVLQDFEGPAYCQAHDLAAAADETGLRRLEEVLWAMKLTQETRDASVRMGKALLRISSQILEDPFLHAYYRNAPGGRISYPLAYGLLVARLQIPKQDGLRAYLFSSVNGVVQSGIKLIPLGITQAQQLLAWLHPLMEEVAAAASLPEKAELASFFPALDIASMRHEVLPTRLYMS